MKIVHIADLNLDALVLWAGTALGGSGVKRSATDWYASSSWRSKNARSDLIRRRPDELA